MFANEMLRLASSREYNNGGEGLKILQSAIIDIKLEEPMAYLTLWRYLLESQQSYFTLY